MAMSKLLQTPAKGLGVITKATVQEVCEVAIACASLVLISVSDDWAAIVEKTMSTKGEGVRQLVRTAIVQSPYYKKLALQFEQKRSALKELQPEFELARNEAPTMACAALEAVWKRMPAFKDGLSAGQPLNSYFKANDSLHKSRSPRL